MLPNALWALVKKTPIEERHPGLQLDKLSFANTQVDQRQALEQVIRTSQGAQTQGRELYRQLYHRWEQTLASAGAQTFQAAAGTPLTLHLSRAIALENVGLCLHPVYGFPYLLGSGLKGLARTYAETIWLPIQSNCVEARRIITEAFGRVSNSDQRYENLQDQLPAARPQRTGNHAEIHDDITAQIGSIIFSMLGRLPARSSCWTSPTITTQTTTVYPA